MDASEIKGFIGLYLTPEGKIFSAVNSFDLSCPGGFTLPEIQKMRVREMLAKNVIEGYSPQLARTMDECDMFRALRRLPGKKVYIPIGHEGLDIEEE